MIKEADWASLITRHARSFHHRMLRSGIRSFAVDDIEQEFWIGFVRARDTFDEARGVPFEAYLVEGLRRVKHEIRRKLSRRFEEEVGASLDSKVDEEASLYELLPDPNANVGEDFERDQMIERFCERLSPRAAIYVRLLYTQPQAILSEMTKLRERGKYASDMGVSHFAGTTISSGVVFKIMGAPRQERTKIRSEVAQAIEAQS